MDRFSQWGRGEAESSLPCCRPSALLGGRFSEARITATQTEKDSLIADARRGEKSSRAEVSWWAPIQTRSTDTDSGQNEQQLTVQAHRSKNQLLSKQVVSMMPPNISINTVLTNGKMKSAGMHRLQVLMGQHSTAVADGFHCSRASKDLRSLYPNSLANSPEIRCLCHSVLCHFSFFVEGIE